ncbi:VOC family protein [Pedobacter gandavensis]|uniref:VOC family protein n=1 Tax=Pedobacter gandavensis TaxID=2679963 RepID=UPI00292FB89F|nr:VOC family protein [Pedobacter gandavensis]
MLKKSKSFSSFSVNDLEGARAFYAGVLGLVVKDNPMGVLELQVEGSTPIVIYPKANHEPASFTVLNFPVQNLEATLDELVKKGVHFEHYDQEGFKTNEKGILIGEGPLIAWFKDPAGNILSILEMN